MNSNQKGFATLVVLLAALCLAAIGIGTYFYVFQTAKPKPVPAAQKPIGKPVEVASTTQDTANTAESQRAAASTTTAAVDTSGWQTYRNEEYGFEFKYPENEFFGEIAGDAGFEYCDISKVDRACSICGNDSNYRYSGEGIGDGWVGSSGREYCRCENDDIAMGVGYDTYRYVTAKNNKCFFFSFTVTQYHFCADIGDECYNENQQTNDNIKLIEQTFKFTN
jgi:hypothetical protein